MKGLTRLIRIGMAAWFLIGGLASRVGAVEIVPSSLAIPPSAIDPKAEILKAKYGSRFMCEAKREQVIAQYSLFGMGLGMLGAWAVGNKDKSENQYNPASSNMLFLGGVLVGAAAGWGLGVLMAPDCTPLIWTEKSQESWKQWKIAEKGWMDCRSRHDWTVRLWSMGGMVVGGLGGGLIAGKASGEGEIVPTILGLLVGTALGGLAGSLIGESKAQKCDAKPPSPELFMPVEQTSQPITVPAPNIR